MPCGPPRSNQRRLSLLVAVAPPDDVGPGRLHPSGLAMAPGRPSTVPLHPERGVRARFPRVRDRARQGRNGAAGASAADEPGPKGDVQILAVRAPILMWNLPERTCLYAVRSPRTRSCAPVSPPYFPASVRVATWGCQPDSGRRRQVQVRQPGPVPSVERTGLDPRSS